MRDHTTPVIEVTGLHKRYGSKAVLRGIDLALAPGEHVGLVGNNGQGKTTLLRLMLGLLRPDAGSVSLAGRPAGFPRSAGERRVAGYLPEAVQLYPNLTGRRTLRFLARLKGAPRAQVDEVLHLVGLAHAADERVKGYSKGMRQRLGLAQALLGDPALLLLDEPTNGLDPAGIREFYAIVRRLQARGVAVLTASHLLAELEPRLDRLAVLRDGVLGRQGSIAELVAETRLPVSVQFALRRPPGGIAPLLERLGAQPSPNGHPYSYEVRCAPHDKLATLQALLAQSEVLVDLHVREPGLEEVFHRLQAQEPPTAASEGGRA